jgi:plastocyanin
MLPDTSHAFPRALGLVLGSLALLAACGDGGGGEKGAASSADSPAPSSPPGAPPSPSGRSASDSTLALTGDEPFASTEFGALHGTILFAGDPPERFVLPGTGLPECKHHPEVDTRSNVIVVNDGALAGVFVTLASGYDESEVPAAPTTPVTLAQKGCMYVPRVVALQLGQKLRVSNEDPTNHNVHMKAKRNNETNRNMGAKQPALEFGFERAELPVPFACDIHPWMGAAVFVEKHPWFALSDEHGKFTIANVPPGEYQIQAVHESRELASRAGKVTVVAGKSTGFTLTFKKK